MPVIIIDGTNIENTGGRVNGVLHEVVRQFEIVSLAFLLFSLREKGDVPTWDVGTEGLPFYRHDDRSIF